MMIVITRNDLSSDGNKEEHERLREEIFALTRKAKGFAGSVVMSSREDPTKYARITIWDSHDDWKAFHESEEFHDLKKRMWHLWGTPPAQEFYDVVHTNPGENSEGQLF